MKRTFYAASPSPQRFRSTLIRKTNVNINALQAYKRAVIKVGSALLCREDGSGVREQWLKSFCHDVATLRDAGMEVIIVSSGAVGLGRALLPNAGAGASVEEKQALAAVGQCELMRAYRETFRPLRITAAQILLTYADCENRRSYLNIRETVRKLLEFGAVPVINENDSVATHELRFGDNDRLAAVVAQMTGCDALFLMSDVDGLYSANPNIAPEAEHIARVEEITPEIASMASGTVSSVGSGGMTTKIEAARICLRSGCDVLLFSGRYNSPVSRVMSQQAKYTLFPADKSAAVSSRKKWILGNVNIKGTLVADPGAVAALRNGKSLLPAGVIDIQGDFERGDTVIVTDARRRPVARGLSAYDAAEAQTIKGHSSAEISHITGFAGREELIHRDNLVLTGDIADAEGKE